MSQNSGYKNPKNLTEGYDVLAQALGGPHVSFLRRSLYLLCYISKDPRKLVSYLSNSKDNTASPLLETRALNLLFFFHLPLFLMGALICVLSPLNYLQIQNEPFEISFDISRFSLHQYLFPTILIIFFVFYAMMYDKILEYRYPKMSLLGLRVCYPHISLLLHMPVVSLGIFFSFHKILGYFFLFFCELWAIYYSLELTSSNYQITRARAFIYWLSSFVLLLLIFLGIGLVINLIDTLPTF